MQDKYASTTIQKALDVLTLFRNHTKLSFTELTELSGLNKSTLFRVLHTLEKNKFLFRDKNGRYEIGLNIFVLGNRFSRAYHIRKVASPYLKELCERLGLAVHMGILDGTEVVIVDKHDPPHNIKMISRIGATVPAHCTGQGKTLLAYSPEEDVRRIVAVHGLKAFTPTTITTLESLFEELAAIRQRGYTIDDSEHEKHIRCVAVPLLNEQNGIEAAISVAGLTMDLKDQDAIINCACLLQRVRDKIRIELGFGEQAS